MENGKLKSDGGYETELQTPYGTASLYFQDADIVNVYLRNHGGRILHVRYERKGATALWKQATDRGGRRQAEWTGTVDKKERPKISIVLEALLLEWLKNHNTDLEVVRVAKLRYRAWNTAQSANFYRKEAERAATMANEIESAIGTNLEVVVERQAV